MRPLVSPSLASALLLAACGAGGLEVTDAWGRSSPGLADTAAFYVTIHNASDRPDRLLGASTDRCGGIEFHESRMDDQGVMRMRPASPEQLDIAPGGTLTMAPGGLHLMCRGLTKPLAPGDEVSVELEFEDTGGRTIEVAIEDR